MTGRRLAGRVHVSDDNGVPHVFGIGDEVPEWAAARITNPAAWAPAPARAGSAAQEPAQHPAPATASGSPPPRSGRGSSRTAWAAYAAAKRVQVAATADRDAIAETLRAAGVRVD